MKRQILQKLQAWRFQKNRKPLILKGVRQCGKTYILKTFMQEFQKGHYINFEKNLDVHTIFKPNLDPKRILNELSFYLNSTINIETDIIIFDEIQACPEALTSLKYFCEDMPQMAICAAGSLLGLHLSSGSFPVGKVDFLEMHPMTFSEFLTALHDTKSEQFLALLSMTSETSRIPEVIHQHLWEQLKKYLIIGGMPEVVQQFQTQQQDNLRLAFENARQKQEAILAAYYADIAKHAGKVNALHIDRVLRAVPAQLARSQDQASAKFKFKNIVPGIDRYQRLADSIDWLEAAGLILKVPIVKSAEMPLSAYTQENIFKLYLFDIGFLGAMSQLPPKIIWDYQYGTYKGYYAENFIAQSLLSNATQTLYSWQDSRSEVEFLCTHQDKLFPIEVKSGSITKSQSLNKLVEKYHLSQRVIFSGRSMAIDLQHGVYHYPLYLADKFLSSSEIF